MGCKEYCQGRDFLLEVGLSEFRYLAVGFEQRRISMKFVFFQHPGVFDSQEAFRMTIFNDSDRKVRKIIGTGSMRGNVADASNPLNISRSRIYSIIL